MENVKKEKESVDNNKNTIEKATKECYQCIKLLILFIIYMLITCLINKYNTEYINRSKYIQKREYKHEIKTKKFALIQRLECPQCGFFSFYIVHLGCINKTLSLGYIRILDLQSFPNVYNGNDTS